MKRKYNILFITLLFPSIVLSQKPLTKEQVLEDYKVLKNVLIKGHPSLYDFTAKPEWDRLFIDFEESTLKTIKNDNELYKSIIELTDYVRDGHLIVMHPPVDSIPNLFPLLLKIIEGQFYTDTDDFGIPVGSEIVSIDGIEGMELRKRLLKYAPSDGFNTSKKDRQVEREFGILLFYEFGAKSTYQVTYKTPANQEIIRHIESQPFESMGKRFIKRNSYFSIYHHRENKADFVKNTLGKKEPFLYFIDSMNTAVLTLNTFGLNQEKFQLELKELFKEIKRKKVEQLVIDIRQNEGGYPENSNEAFSYIAKESFVQPKSQHVITSQLPHKEHSQEIINDYTYESFFEQYFQNSSQIENEWVIYAPEDEASMAPIKKGFEGQVYVLVGGKTFSAGSTFALNCKNQGITLIGEETGGGYYSHTGGYPVIYELPHSKIKMMMSYVKVKKYVKDETVKKGTGVIPDVEVNLTVQDLIKGKDSQLDYVLKQINKK
ncbi:MAG: S41 family peptidase [Bacteroidota bacterium]